MGKGIHGQYRPPPAARADQAPYIDVYKAVGGWQSQLVFWAGSHWDVWDTGNGPYGYEADARADASAWASSWQIQLRLPDAAPDPARAPTFLETMAAKGIAVTVVGHEPGSGKLMMRIGSEGE